jgi:hypothetical protein
VKPAEDKSDGKVSASGKNKRLTVSTWNLATEKEPQLAGGILIQREEEQKNQQGHFVC